MAHRSENASALAIRALRLSDLNDLPVSDGSSPDVWLFVLPYGRTIADAENSHNWFDKLRAFARSLHEQSVVAILTSPQDAAETWPQLGDYLKFQLWVAVRLENARRASQNMFPEHHAAVLILTKYRKPLRHTKTRIGYTFCPACDKTTKDYGGKKHTYNSYGTLVSDVWRDIEYAPGEQPTHVAERLADLFGLEPYSRLTIVDATALASMQPAQAESQRPQAGPRVKSKLKSKLISGDSLAELRKLRANSIDFCFADPPYNLDKKYDAWDDAIDVKDYLRWCDEWLDELARVLRPGRTCAVLNIPILAIRHFQHMKSSLDFQSWIVWEGLSLPVRMIMPAHYSIVCFSKGVPRALPGLSQSDDSNLKSLRQNFCLRQACVEMRRKMRQRDREPITNLWWDIHRLKHNSRRVDHPCQLPPALMRRLIALFTAEDEIVLDPFNGAGTTTLCAAELKRRYIGIELSSKYHELALARHKLLQDGIDPFEKLNRVPKAKNSRVQRVGGMKYQISKKALQLEVRRVARLLGRLPSREELQIHGQHPIRFYDDYFISWGEVCAAARHDGMSETRDLPERRLSVHQPTLFDA